MFGRVLVPARTLASPKARYVLEYPFVLPQAETQGAHSAQCVSVSTVVTAALWTSTPPCDAACGCARVAASADGRLLARACPCGRSVVWQLSSHRTALAGPEAAEAAAEAAVAVRPWAAGSIQARPAAQPASWSRCRALLTLLLRDSIAQRHGALTRCI